nr:cysteine-rich receptor-like protein kinase [Tanacetum cinerariifolium]
MFSYVKDFEMSAHIPRGCNSSFTSLVPKVDDPLVVEDFRTISLIGSQYKIIPKILANRLSRVVSSVVSDVQMAYIKGRQIIDGPLMVHEIIAWSKKHKERLMFFKVDFEKAFDSLSWSFLFSIPEQIGVSFKWRNLIHSCLSSAYASILVNGSPTKEFKIKRGLIQGDPLSLFFFILAVFHKRLSKWKSKSLSFGGRLTLIKPVLGSLGVYYFSSFKAPKKVICKLESIRRKFFWGGGVDENKISWIAWDKVISPRDK